MPDKTVILCQALDGQEVEVVYAIQIQIIDSFLWENVKNPITAIENMFLAQLRIIIKLFKADDTTSLKGSIAGMLSGERYLVWRRKSDGELLKSDAKSILAIKDDEDSYKQVLEETLDQVTREALVGYQENIAQGKNLVQYTITEQDEGGGERKTDYFAEIIPASTFDYQAVINEAKRVGARVESIAITDITPPEAVRKAAEEKQIEEFQGDAREIEAERHKRAALIKLGFNPDTEKPKDLDPLNYARWEKLVNDAMVQEGTAQKIIVESGSGGSPDLGDKLIAAANIASKKGGK